MYSKIKIRKLLYIIRARYLTLNNVILVAALLIAVNWAWGSIEMMQRNYGLQKNLDLKNRQKRIAELEVQKLEYEQSYYRSSEYMELAARQSLGLADPGEKVLILPPNSEEAKKKSVDPNPPVSSKAPSNLTQWMNFLFGSNYKDLQ